MTPHNLDFFFFKPIISNQHSVITFRILNPSLGSADDLITCSSSSHHGDVASGWMQRIWWGWRVNGEYVSQTWWSLLVCSAYLSVDWTAAQAQSQELRRRSSNLVISDASRGRFQSAVCVGYTEGKKNLKNTSVGTQKQKEKEQERREKKKKKKEASWPVVFHSQLFICC